MIIPPINHDQATKLAALIHALRPDWDKPGILDALAKARNRGNASDVCIAAIRCATGGHARTPAVIALDGAHWRPPETKPMGGSRVLVTGRCDDCGHLHPPADPCIAPREQTQAAARRNASQARQQLRQARDELCPHGVLTRDCADHRNPEDAP